MAKAEKENMEFGHLAKAIKERGKESKPVLRITARMDDDYFGGPMEATSGPNDWRKKELARHRKEVKAMEDEIASWDEKAASERALKSLKVELAIKKARVMESEAMLGED